jgi:hypothetical protein
MLNMLQLAGIRQLINKIEKLEEKINLIWYNRLLSKEKKWTMILM